MSRSRKAAYESGVRSRSAHSRRLDRESSSEISASREIRA
jgi:hypothetical protein